MPDDARISAAGLIPHETSVQNENDDLIRLIESSPFLRAQTRGAILAESLQSIRVSNRPGQLNMSGFYDASSRSIEIDANEFSRPQRAELPFLLGHELRHALNSPSMTHEINAFGASTVQSARSAGDHTSATARILDATRLDEATANLSGWNAFVDSNRTGVGPSPRHRLGASWRSRSVLGVDVDGRHAFLDGYEPNRDLTLSESPTNVETMAREFYDLPGHVTRLGPLGDSDYRHCYAAWAIGFVGEVHVAHQAHRDAVRRERGRSPRATGPLELDPLRLAFSELGVDIEQLHRTGLDFGGTPHIPFHDTGTGRTALLTATDPKDLPRPPLPRLDLAAREQLSAPSLGAATSERRGARTPQRTSSTRSAATEPATVRARRTSPPRAVGQNARTPPGRGR